MAAFCLGLWHSTLVDDPSFTPASDGFADRILAALALVGYFAIATLKSVGRILLRLGPIAMAVVAVAILGAWLLRRSGIFKPQVTRHEFLKITVLALASWACGCTLGILLFSAGIS